MVVCRAHCPGGLRARPLEFPRTGANPQNSSVDFLANAVKRAVKSATTCTLHFTVSQRTFESTGC